MSSTRNSQNNLEEFKVNVRIKISALWTTIMFCYIYADYFELYIPGKLASMLAGNIDPLGQVTQAKLIATAILLALPTALIFLSTVLSSRVARWTNIIFGTIYTFVAIATLCAPGAWFFYRGFCVIEILLTVMIVWSAWHWPKQRDVKNDLSCKADESSY